MVPSGRRDLTSFLRATAAHGVLAAFVLALGAAACSSPAATPTVLPTATATTVPTPTATPAPRARLETAVTRLQSARSYKFTVDLQVAVKSTGASLSIPVKADGAFAAPDRRRARISGSVLGQSFAVEQVRIGSAVYSRQEGQETWTQGDQIAQVLPPALSGLLAFAAPDIGAAGLLAATQNASLIGDEDLNGEKTLHLVTQMPFTNLGEGFQEAAALVQVDMWIGKDDGLPRKMTVSGGSPLTLSAATDPSGIGQFLKDPSLDLTATLLFTEYNAPISIESPLATSAGVDPNKLTIRFADTQHESVWINNAIARFIVEKGYGYPVESVQTTAPNAIPQLGSGGADVLLEGVEQDFKDAYASELAKGTVRNLGPLHSGVQQFYVIPRWVHEQHAVATIADMADPAVAALFQDPSSGGKGVFLNCMAALPCAPINDVKLEAYGLSAHYTMRRATDPGALDSALQSAQAQKKAVFAYYWAPNAFMGSGDWYVLQEPVHSTACWDRIAEAQRDATLRPLPGACAYPSTAMNVLVSATLASQAPDVVAMLDRMSMTVDALSETAAWMRAYGTADYTAAAVRFLMVYQDQWTAWVPRNIADKIIGVLPLPESPDAC